MLACVATKTSRRAVAGVTTVAAPTATARRTYAKKISSAEGMLSPLNSVVHGCRPLLN